MRILIINTVCKTGSIGKITYDLHKRLKEIGHESIICYGRGEVYPDEKDLIRFSSLSGVYLHTILARISGNSGCYSNTSTTKLLQIMDKFKPDVVQLFNLHGYYVNEFRLLDYLKQKGIKTVYSMLDEYPYMGKCTYSYDCDKFKTECNHCPQTKAYPKSIFFDKSTKIFRLKKKAYEDFNNVVFTAPRWVVEERAKSSVLLSQKRFAVIDESTNLEETFYPRNTSELRLQLGFQEDKRIILMVGQFSPLRKGGIHFLNLARCLEKENMLFINIGYDGDKKNLPNNFVPISYVVNQDELATYYSLADLLVCTSLADTMPNVCLEALACGTPVCGFDAAGIPDVATSEFGIFTPTGNIEALASVVKNTPKKTNERAASCRKYAEKRYSSKMFFEKILKLYETKYFFC